MHYFKTMYLCLSFLAWTDATFADEYPICENLKAYMAQESGAAIVAHCASMGVSMKRTDVQRWFSRNLTSNEAPRGECLATCATQKAFNGTEMADCVQNSYTAPFIQGMIGTGRFNSQGCMDLKNIL